MKRRIRSIAIIGAGFSGTITAVRLLERAAPGDRILLFEKAPPFGRGIAYNTDNPSHLLNVRASSISALDENPLDFVEWLNSPAAGDIGPLTRPVAPSAFVPRSLYGRYLQERLYLARRNAADDAALSQEAAEVVDITPTRDGLAAQTGDGRSYSVDTAVLAIGHAPPDRTMLPHYAGNPWDPRATRDLDPAAEVVILGTGLTMVDVVLSLADQGHTGRIHAVSRHGLLPRPQGPAAGPDAWPLRIPLPDTCGGLLRYLREEADSARTQGHSWQDVILALRPRVQEIWQDLSLSQQQQFLRHLRPWWEVHRHRIPPEAGARIAKLTQSGQLRVLAGRIEGRTLSGDSLEVRLRPRGSDSTERLHVARVINCSGTSPAQDLPVLKRLFARGEARPDAHGLGVAVDGNCAAIDCLGRASGRLYAIGPLTRGTFWEVTAVPEIGRQAAALAWHLLPRPAFDRAEAYKARAQ